MALAGPAEVWLTQLLATYICSLGMTHRISCQRLRTVQQKGDAQAKSNRRDIATLVEKGKLETARIKVENSMVVYSSGSEVHSSFWDMRISYQSRHTPRTAGTAGAVLRTTSRPVWGP
jgi:hypothetical protein